MRSLLNALTGVDKRKAVLKHVACLLFADVDYVLAGQVAAELNQTTKCASRGNIGI